MKYKSGDQLGDMGNKKQYQKIFSLGNIECVRPSGYRGGDL